MELHLASKYGLCHGVKRAIEIVNKTKEDYPNEQVYLLNKVVHNDYICNDFEKKGIITLSDNRSLIEKINSIEKGIIIFSAHGHDERLNEIAEKKGLIVVDSACPRVIANNYNIKKELTNKENIVYIGIKNHPETEASLSLSNNIIFLDYKNPDYSLLKNLTHCSVHNQTTLIKDDLIDIYQNIMENIKDVRIYNDICLATTERQNALKSVLDEELIVIIGDKISSNTTRLYELAKKIYPDKFVIQVSSTEDLKQYDLSKYKKGFITAGASAPEQIINPILDYLRAI